MEKKNFTVSVYTENNIGLLSRIAAIFQKRHINIESITASRSEVNGVMRFIIVVQVTPKFFVIEKTGKRHETDSLYEKLKPYGLMQFVRSGTIAVTKNEMPISNILEQFDTTN